MTAYLIAEHEIHDAAKFEEYRVRVRPLIAKHGGRYLTGGDVQVLDGAWRPTRAVIIAFPDMGALRAWYESPEYQPLIALRRSAARDVLLALEGA